MLGTSGVPSGFSAGTSGVLGTSGVPSGFSVGTSGVFGTSGVPPGFVSSLTLFDNTIMFLSTTVVLLSLSVTSYFTE